MPHTIPTPPKRGGSAASLAIAIAHFLVCNVGHADPAELQLRDYKRAVVTNYAAIVGASYEDALIGAKQLQTAVDEFLLSPSEPALKRTREAWLAARVPYLQTETCRFYDGPIDQADGAINAWPIDENYIDYVEDHPTAGVINATAEYPTLTRELIVSLNEVEGQKNVTTGFHAIEFLLWGQDLDPCGPGKRSWNDYAAGATNADRRRDYLRIVTELLVEDLEAVAIAWRRGLPGNYRTAFLALDPDAALGMMLTGMGVLSGSELAGERLTAPYETKEQEDEHSCFSDSTCQDMVYNAIGIRNVYRGHYPTGDGGTVNGPGVHDLLRRVDPDFANKVAAQMDVAVAAARSIPHPFDQAILGKSGSPGRVAIKASISAFQTQSDMLAKAAHLLSANRNF